MASGVLSSAPVVWRLQHVNGQSASCAIVPVGTQYRLQRRLNDFVTGAEEFASRDDATKRAADIRRDFERRGFRDDM